MTKFFNLLFYKHFGLNKIRLAQVEIQIFTGSESIIDLFCSHHVEIEQWIFKSATINNSHKMLNHKAFLEVPH